MPLTLKDKLRTRFACTLRPFVVAFGFLLLTGYSANAITLADYHNKVRTAVSALDSLAQTDEAESADDFKTRSSETINGVRGLLPKTESVAWNGATFTVDYTWLHRELDTLGSVAVADRAATLRRITERLQAIEERVSEVEESSAVSADKEADAKKLAEILARPEYARKIKESSVIARLIKWIFEWLKDLFPKAQPVAPGTASIFSKIAQVFVIALALAVLAFVIKLLLPRLRSTRQRKKKTKPEPRIVLGEKLEPDQSARDLLADAEALARRGELRAAIRKTYIALLVELGDRKIISLAQYKTNRDYLRAVRDVHPLYGNVRTLTDSFERHWYGLSNATESDWIAFRSAYERALVK